MRRLWILFLLTPDLILGQVLDDAWRELSEKNNVLAARALFEQAVFSEPSADLARIGWFLTFTGNGPDDALVDAALNILARDGDGAPAEFVMRWMDPMREQLPRWVHAAAEMMPLDQVLNPELRVLYAKHLKLAAEWTGDSALHERALDLSAQIMTWRFSERFGAYPAPDFEKTWPADHRAYWDQRPTQTSRTGVVIPPEAVQGPGVIYAQSQFNNPADQDLIFRLFTYQDASVFVDGKCLIQVRNLEEFGRKVRVFSARIPKGSHDVVVKLTQTRGLNGQFSLQITGPQDPTFPDPARPVHDLQMSEPVAREIATGLTQTFADDDSDLARLVLAFMDQVFKDDDRAVDTLEQLYTAYPMSQHVGGLLAQLYLETVSYLPPEIQLSRAFNILQQLYQDQHCIPENTFRLAQLMVRARQPEQAAQLVDVALEANPGYCDALAFKLDLAQENHMLDEKERILENLWEFGPNHRWAQKQILAVSKKDGDLTTTKEVLANLARNLPWEWHGADLDELNEDFPAAIEKLKKLWDLYPNMDFLPFAIARDYARLGDRVMQRQWLEKTMKLNPSNRNALLDLVNLDCYEGDSDVAYGRIQEYLNVNPADSEFRQMASHLLGATAFESFRVNTEEVISRAMSRPPSQGADSELLLDQLMVRLFEDGSQMRYTHLVTRVLTKDGVDQDSELNLPGDLEILELRTIKPDGTVRYPEDIELKSSISLSGLSVGDFIDEEHIEYLPPAYYDRDGLDANMTFIFQGVDRIYHHSELVLIYPQGLDPEPVILTRNFNGTQERMEENGRVHIRWLAKDVPPLRAEPAMPPTGAVLPTVTFYYNTQWEEVRDFFTHAARTRMKAGLALQRQIREWQSQDQPMADRVRSIYREVVDAVEGDGSFYQDVNLTWASGSGNASLLLATIYKEMGLSCDVVFTRPALFNAYVFDTPLPDLFSHVLLRLQLGDETVWLDANRDGLPFGYVPADLQGSVGLVLNTQEPAALIPIPDGRLQDEEVSYTYALELNADGSATGEGVESFRGDLAARLKTYYAQLNRPEIIQRVEAGINEHFPGAEAHLATVVEDLPPGEFQLKSLFSHPGLVRHEDGRLDVPFLLPETPLLDRFGSMATRLLPVMISDPLVNQAEMTMKAPEGFLWEVEPTDLEFQTPFGAYALTVAAEGDQLTIHRSYQVPARILPVDQYPEFQAFCKRISEVEQRRFTAVKAVD